MTWGQAVTRCTPAPAAVREQREALAVGHDPLDVTSDCVGGGDLGEVTLQRDQLLGGLGSEADSVLHAELAALDKRARTSSAVRARSGSPARRS